MPELSFKSYYWGVGTTSFRTENFNYQIEFQLEILDKFWKEEENLRESWSGNKKIQERYYLYLNKMGFLKNAGAKLPDKDARQKTSGLVDIGLINDERRLTEVGRALLNIARTGDFSSDNFLEIQKDSFIYFKQLLKTHVQIEDRIIRPFMVFLYFILKKDYLTYEEFTYLLPLCIDRDTTINIEGKIDDLRQNRITCDDIIIDTFMSMPNYQAGLRMLKNNPVSEDLICEIGMNRKSRSYDRPYFVLYDILRRIVFEKEEMALELYNAVSKIRNTTVLWRRHLFKKSDRSYIDKYGLSSLNNVPILESSDMDEFNERFFKLIHLFRAKKNLSDYFDLNRRYFKITDAVIFEDEKVALDILPLCYFEGLDKKLISAAFEESDKLQLNCRIEDIEKFLEVDKNKIYKNLEKHIGEKVEGSSEARDLIKKQKYSRFNTLIDKKFTKENLISLLNYFEERNDEEIRKLVTDNADIPTIFEYILAIIWYIVSEKKGDVLDYMKLSLEADLLPKTHAGGGEADIIWEYSAADEYTAHTLLIEATLSDGSNQRRMEMEPVSRHLGEYLLHNPEKEAYSIFIATCLNLNVISDFRGRRKSIYYSSDGESSVEGLKIVPIQTNLLKYIIDREITYRYIYKILEGAYNKELPPKDWYEALEADIIKK